MKNTRLFALIAAGAAAALPALVLTVRSASQAKPPPRQPPRSIRPAQPALTHAQLLRLRPDEVGRIPILMYHAVGAAHSGCGARYDRRGLNIAPGTFRQQLQEMYGVGWYPINMRDVLTSHLNVPAGKTPVVLTFDDARGTQFRYLRDGRIDPNCAVGILETFHTSHPDWPLRATFYVLPKSLWNPVPFWQPGREAQKLNFLVSQGFEVANHSTSHRLMGHMDAHTLSWEMAQCVRYVRARAPSATMDTMALPGGDAPRNHALWGCLLRGQSDGTRYQNRCILMAWGGPAYPWTHKKFDPERVWRIGSLPGAIERWIQRSRLGKRVRFYVSDGDPDVVTVPRSQLKYVDRYRLQGARLRVYNDTQARGA